MSKRRIYERRKMKTLTKKTSRRTLYQERGDEDDQQKDGQVRIFMRNKMKTVNDTTSNREDLQETKRL